MSIRLVFVSFCAFLTLTAQEYNPALWSNLKYRMIGPERGGRVTAVTGVPAQPYTLYMGSTGGGPIGINHSLTVVAPIGAARVSMRSS